MLLSANSMLCFVRLDSVRVQAIILRQEAFMNTKTAHLWHYLRLQTMNEYMSITFRSLVGKWKTSELLTKTLLIDDCRKRCNCIELIVR